jgi:hypothetical protein
MFDYPLYKLRGPSCAVFRACITSVFEKENYIRKTFTMQNFQSNARLLVECATVLKKQRAYARLWCIVPARLRKRAGSLDSAMNRLIDRSAKAGLNPCKSETIIGKLNEPN